jgi:hypothetical protein
MRLVLLFLIAACPLALAESAEEMLSACEKITESKVKDGKVSLPQDFDSGRCWGAFGVLQGLSALQTTDGNRPFFHVCAPENSSRTQYVAIFVEYVKRNPRRFNDEFWVVALDALRAAFQCQPK